MSKVFGTESCTPSDLPSISSHFKDARELLTDCLFAGQSVNGTVYACFKLDKKVIEVYIESSNGPSIFVEFRRVLGNAITAISRSQGFPWTYEISWSDFYDDVSNKTMGLEARPDTWNSRLSTLSTKFNFSILFFTYLFAVGVNGWLWPSGTLFSWEKLLVQPSVYAPAAVVFYGFVSAFMKPSKGVIICEKN